MNNVMVYDYDMLSGGVEFFKELSEPELEKSLGMVGVLLDVT